MNEFEKYYEMSEKTGWRVNDLNWDKIDKQNISDFDKQIILATSVIEHGVPHYTETWTKVRGIEKEWELWQLVTLWAGEEHRHSFALKKLADILDIQGNEKYYDKVEKGEYYYDQISKSHFSDLQKESCVSDCYSSIGGMLTYTAIQELVTAKFYQTAIKKTKSKFVTELLSYISKDEFKHHAFYAQAIKRYYEKSDNKEQYLEDVYNASVHFNMPHMIYDKKFDFFEEEVILTKMDQLEIKLRMGKVLAFNKSIVKKILTNKSYSDVSDKVALAS